MEKVRVTDRNLARALTLSVAIALTAGGCTANLFAGPGPVFDALSGANPDPGVADMLAEGRSLARDVLAALQAQDEVELAQGTGLGDRSTQQAGIVAKNSSKFSVASLGAVDAPAGKDGPTEAGTGGHPGSGKNGRTATAQAAGKSLAPRFKKSPAGLIRDASGSVVASVAAFDWESAGGLKARATRTLERAGDGAPAARLRIEFTRPDGKTRTFDWDAAARPDGGERGTGRILGAGGAAADFSYERTAGGATVARAADPAAGVAVEVKMQSGAPGATATIVAQADGRVLETVILDGTP